MIVYYNDSVALVEDVLMSFFGFMKGTWKTFGPSGYLSGEYQDVKNQSKTIWGTLKGLFIKPRPENQESFEQAMQRLKLSIEDADNIANRYRRYALIFLLFGVILFTYAFYLLFEYFSVTGWLLALAATTLCLAYAFNYDFWSYQIRIRKLGVSFNEWLDSILGKRSST